MSNTLFQDELQSKEGRKNVAKSAKNRNINCVGYEIDPRKAAPT
jgi:hypothetical protein